MIIKGTVWKFGENINTDVIAPTSAKAASNDPMARAQHCLEAINPDFARSVQQGDIVVAGRNFGCGSSRQTAPENLKMLGVSCVIAPSFGRIFLRNSINIGLPLLECARAPETIEEGDLVEVDISGGRILNITKGVEICTRPFPPFLLSIIEQGGIFNYARARLEAMEAPEE
jgi:3-isopropylmalate/(R)-2-methylmalate dehydratase small subunit